MGVLLGQLQVVGVGWEICDYMGSGVWCLVCGGEIGQVVGELLVFGLWVVVLGLFVDQGVFGLCVEVDDVDVYYLLCFVFVGGYWVLVVVVVVDVVLFEV